MSLQWTFIATFLYTEIFLCVLLMLPIISPQRWQKIFKSRLFNSFRSYANLYFNIFIVILIILFIDAVKDMSKYQGLHTTDLKTATEVGRLSVDMKMFRSQRNFYLSGFTILLWIVLRKLVTAISTVATLQADCETMKKQAESANAVAKQLMEDKDNKTNEKEEGETQKAVAAVENKELEKLRNELIKANKDIEAMKKQTESTNREYDRLLKEHADVQEKCKALEGNSGSKKDE